MKQSKETDASHNLGKTNMGKGLEFFRRVSPRFQKVWYFPVGDDFGHLVHGVLCPLLCPEILETM
jgi:hypothetical protein